MHKPRRRTVKRFTRPGEGQRRAELALQDSEARYRLLAENSTDLIARLTPEGLYLYVSQAVKPLLGYDPYELLGLSAYDLYHSDDFAEIADNHSSVLDLPDTFTVSYRIRRKDGEYIWFETTSRTVREADTGMILEIHTASRDISLRKIAEEQLRHTMIELEEQYRKADHASSEMRAVLDAAGEAMALVSPDRRLGTVNRRFADFFGVQPDAAAGHLFAEFEGEVRKILADPDRFLAGVADTAADSSRQFTEIIVQRWPEHRELQLYSTPVLSAGDVHLGRLYVFRDVTHEREVDRMKSEFVSLVSHELRTPLTSIKGYVDLLIDGEVGDVTEEQSEFLGIVKNNADRLVSLINDLLDISRIESGKVELRRSTLDLTRLIAAAAGSLRPQMESKNQSLTLDLPRDLPSVWCDSDRVTQIMINLISNAHKYTPAGGAVRIAAMPTSGGAQVRVEVQDSGIGMSKDELAQLFTKFFRSKSRAAQEVGGTGLGLSITRSLVEMHGGEISVSSAQGQGSTFSFTLPVTEAPIVQADEPSAAPHPGSRVLVVDDQPDIAGLIVRYLERGGYTALTARDGAEALQMARDEQPDLITLDVMLPDADGFTVLEWLKQDPATAHIPVVVISVLADRGQARILGAVEYLTKPVSEPALLERVAQVLSGDRPRRILVADDDADIRHLLSGHLRRAGYEVVEAADGAEALALAAQEPPGLALLDVRMPELDGIGVLRALRMSPETRDMPVLIMTAGPALLDHQRSMIAELGGITLSQKPLTIEELVGALSRGLR
ncbi:MAG: response regulator [Chloroflexi bacterium]|nr:response regulator [Chloroflexota bacterium]